MKKLTALVIAAMMLLGLMSTAWAEEPAEEVQLPAAAETESSGTETEAPALPEAKGEPEAAPAETTELPAQEAQKETETPEQQAEPEADPAESAEDDSEKSVTSETDDEDEEEAEEKAFTADVTVYVPARIRLGKTLRIKALISGANMEYTLRWEKKVVTDDGLTLWKTVSKKVNLKLVVDEEVLATAYRLVMTAEDGTVKTYAVPELKLSEDVGEDYEDEEEFEDEDEEEDLVESEDVVDDEEQEDAAATDEAAEEVTEEVAGEVTEETVEENNEEDPEENLEKEPEEQPEEVPEEDPAEEPVEDTDEIEDQETEPAEEMMTLTAETVLREQADGMSAVLEELPEGSELRVLAAEGDWLKVSLGETVGYIYQPVEAEDEAEPEAEPVRKVTIFTSRKAVMIEGEDIELTSELEGFENNEIRYQWECDKGEGFEPVEGANDASYIYTATIEALAWDWRLTVYYR